MNDELSSFLAPLVTGGVLRGAVVALPAYNVRNADPRCDHVLKITSLERLRAGVLLNKCIGCEGGWRPVDLTVPSPLFWLDHGPDCTAVAAVETEIRGLGGDPRGITWEAVPFAGPRRRSS